MKELYRLYVHTDSSENAFLDGTYTWVEGLRRMAILLLEFHSVTFNGTRFFS